MNRLTTELSAKNTEAAELAVSRTQLAGEVNQLEEGLNLVTAEREALRAEAVRERDAAVNLHEEWRSL